MRGNCWSIRLAAGILLAVGGTCAAAVNEPALRHRWAFNGPPAATDITSPTFVEPDLAGGAAYEAIVVGPGADRLGDGTVQLSADPADPSRATGYVDLPNGIISGLSALTVETWVSPRATAGAWERICDFGTTTIGEVAPGSTNAYSGADVDWVYLTAYQGEVPKVALQRNGNIPGVYPLEASWNDQAPERELHVVATYDPASGLGAVYVDGQLKQTAGGAGPLDTLPDVNNWLGRSMWQADANLNGLFNEFRIYEGVLTPRQVAIHFGLGPEDISGDPGAEVSRALDAPATLVVDGVRAVRLAIRYAGLAEPVRFRVDPDLAWSSSDTNVLAVTGDGIVTGVAVGTATVTAMFGGQATAAAIEVVDRRLKHRYAFNGEYTLEYEFPEPDLVGEAAATVYNAYERTGTGALDLAENLTGYVDLPNGIISALGCATFEAWLTPRDFGLSWQRVFDFGAARGTSVDAAGEIADTATYGYTGDQMRSLWLWLGPRGAGEPDLAFAYEVPGAEVFCRIDGPTFSLGRQIHVAVTYNPVAGRAILYLDGIPVGTAAAAGRLDELHDVNNYLGHSQWDADGFLDALYNEFRIYDGVLTPEEIAVNFVLGPDRDPLTTGPGTAAASLTVTAEPAELVIDFVDAQVTAFADFVDGLSGVPVNGFEGVMFTSSDPAIVRVSDAGVATGVSPGVALVGAAYQGLSNSVEVTVTRRLKPAILRHRYSFNETSGTVAQDSVGLAHGTVRGTNFTWTGAEVALPGGRTSATANPTSALRDLVSYVDLPNGMISALSNAVTFEIWFTYDGTSPTPWWQRIWSFGSSTGGEDVSAAGVANGYLFGSVFAHGNGIFVGAPGFDLQTGRFFQNQQVHLVLLYDTEEQIARLYLNGELAAEGIATVPLSTFNDVNNWLGRSQWGTDPMFQGRYNELRIYNGQLSSQQILDHLAWGPDRLTAPVAVPLHASREGSLLSLTWPESIPATVQSTADLGSAGGWQDLPGSPTRTNGVFRQDVPMISDAEAFRLTD